MKISSMRNTLSGFGGCPMPSRGVISSWLGHVLPALIHCTGISSSTTGSFGVSLSSCTGCISIVVRENRCYAVVNCVGNGYAVLMKTSPSRRLHSAIASPSQHLQVDVVPSTVRMPDWPETSAEVLRWASTSYQRRSSAVICAAVSPTRGVAAPPPAAHATSARRILHQHQRAGQLRHHHFFFYPGYVETSYYRLYTTSNTISLNAVTRAWRLQLEECSAERRKPEPI
jgi:hypothetical protein